MELVVVGSFVVIATLFVLSYALPANPWKDLAWLAGASEVSSAESRIYLRYLNRVRRARIAGCWLGIVFALTVGIRYYGQVFIGIGPHNLLSDPLFCGIAGIIAGHLWAERFSSAPSTSTVVTASLTKTKPNRNWLESRLALALVVASGLVGLGAFLWSGTWLPLVLAGFGSIIYAMSVKTTSTITSRSQPALSEPARRVNGRLRDVASASNDNIKLAAGWLTFGWTLGHGVEAVVGPELESVGSLFSLVTVLTCFVLSIVYVRRARLRAPKDFQAQAVVV